MTFNELASRVPRGDDNLVDPKVYERDLLFQVGLEGLDVSCPDIRAYWIYKFYKNGYPIGSMLILLDDMVCGILHIEVDQESHMTWTSKAAQAEVIQAYLSYCKMPKHDFVYYGVVMKDHYNVRATHQLKGVDLSTVTIRGTKPYKVEYLPHNQIGSEHGMMVQMTAESKPMRVSVTIIDIPLPLIPQATQNQE